VKTPQVTTRAGRDRFLNPCAVARFAIIAYLDFATPDDQGNPTHAQGIDIYV